MSKIKIAIFGLNQGARVGRSLQKNQNCQIVAVAGFGQDAKKITKEFGAKLFSDYKKLLTDVTVDAVVIALPNDLHLEAIKNCADKQIKFILLEKPIASTIEDGRAIIDICKRNQITLLVGHHRRSSSLFLFLKDFLAKGKLGSIVGIQSMYAINKNLDYWQTDWHKLPSGGPLLVNAIHDMDDLNNILDRLPDRVYAAKRSTIRGNQAEDSASALIEFDNGPTITYFISDGTPSPWNYDLLAQADERFAWESGQNSMMIYGTKGSFGFPNMDFYTYKSDKEWGWNYPLVKEHFSVPHNNPLDSEADHFVDLCLGKTLIPRCSGEQALNSLKIVNALIESSSTGKVVKIS